jgi:subtilisin family serine protease
LAFALVAAFVSACSGGGGSPHVTSTPSASPTATSTSSSDEAAYQCPTSDVVAGVARSSAGRSSELTRYAPRGSRRTAAAIPGRLAVTYDLRTLTASRASFTARESASGATFVKEYDFPHTSVATRVLVVPAAQQATVMSKLRSEPGVRSVTATGGVRYPQAVTTPYFPNDPFFDGFTSAVTGSTPPTYKVAPYEESAAVGGQWNEHAIGLQDAFAYSQTGNGSGVVNANALGLASVKIAIIDTGEDTTHPELSSKIAYQKCFITDPSGNQSTSTFTTDQDGHGTDVSGLAAADTNNALGFSAPGGNSVIYAYRVQPTPDDNCTSDTTTDPQCLASTDDIASAILDAVAQNVNVISLSLGGGSCTNGVDPDPAVEGAAVTEALAHNIVIVASAGNGGTEGLEAPACDTGVIAVGASALADGQLNGTQTASGNAAAPNEYVASYSDYGSPGAAVKSASAWGIVAPGGDPSNDTDPDLLHWIEDIWTSTPFDVANFGGTCEPDPGGTIVDCRTLIAGTSMSAPTVSGAAALILAANPSYQSPTKMKTLLCTTADDISDPNEGCGRLNVYRAMAVAVGDPTPP